MQSAYDLRMLLQPYFTAYVSKLEGLDGAAGAELVLGIVVQSNA